MPNAQGPGLCSTSVDKKDDHVCSMLVHVVCCNLIRVFLEDELEEGPTLRMRGGRTCSGNNDSCANEYCSDGDCSTHSMHPGSKAVLLVPW